MAIPELFRTPEIVDHSTGLQTLRSLIVLCRFASERRGGLDLWNWSRVRTTLTMFV
jgi:hypothetical protein